MDAGWAHLLAGQPPEQLYPRKQPLIEVVSLPEKGPSPAVAADQPPASVARPSQPEASDTQQPSAAPASGPGLPKTDERNKGSKGAAEKAGSIAAPAALKGDASERNAEPSEENLEGAAAMAAQAQPTGTTFETTNVHTKVLHSARGMQHCWKSNRGLKAVLEHVLTWTALTWRDCASACTALWMSER